MERQNQISEFCNPTSAALTSAAPLVYSGVVGRPRYEISERSLVENTERSLVENRFTVPRVSVSIIRRRIGKKILF